MGSCFSINMGAKMQQSLWPATINPTGTLYNPASIANGIDLALGRRKFSLEYDSQRELWFSFDFSTLFSSPGKVEAAAKMKQGVECLKNAIENAECAIITFGTAWVYEYESQIVANCHKLPSALFNRRRLSMQEITRRWKDIIKELRDINEGLKVIFTVSPVRHLADTFEGNARSKAVLLLACEELAKIENCHYFPAFEILTDDLRDYRFYADDLLHPSATAESYIFEAFARTYLSPASIESLRKGEKEYKRLHHRPLLS